MVGYAVFPALLALALLAPLPATGWADDGLASPDPGDGAALATPPAAVVLTFPAAPDPALSHVSTRDSVGREVGTGAASLTGRLGLRLPVSIRNSGDYTVAYHVVFDDGTELVGVSRFSVGTGVSPAPLAAAHDHGVDPVGGTLVVLDLVVLVGVALMLVRRPVR